MILDCNYSKKKRNLSVSYVTDEGGKKILNFNVDRFKAFYSTPTGQYENWDGSKCDVRWTENPGRFEIRTFLQEMDEKYKQLLKGKVAPKLYTFDIEVKLNENRDFPEPEYAREEITTISIVSPDLNCIVLGTSPLDETQLQYLDESFKKYINSVDFFKTLNLKTPYVKYIQFNTEQEMLQYFLNNIVAKVPILSGWNCIQFDWNYIVNRLRNHFPDLSITSSSCTKSLVNRRFTNQRGDDINLPMPQHTLIIDMMDVMDFDMAVMPIKEAKSLEYISSQTPGLGVHKIQYEGDLQDLYETDYAKYVFYNAIDSILVQLINYRYRTLDSMYSQALYCGCKIQDTFSKIAVSEAMVFNDFYENGIKIVDDGNREYPERDRLLGAYVKIPIPGIHQFVCCNDFASLYPSTIRTCNLSYENYVGHFYQEDVLDKYRIDPMYIVIGPMVFKNKGNDKHPEIGEQVGTFIDENALEKYKKDKNYFVSVNGHVYKNDKDYSFRRIQAKLKANRDHDKYLSKQLDAQVIVDLEHLMKGKEVNKRDYNAEIIKTIKDIGYEVENSLDLIKIANKEEFKKKLKDEITYLTCNEQAIKLIMNSMYGGSSHVAFFWFNIFLANDITGEARNLIHKMEQHIPEYIMNNWMDMKDVHEKLGIEVSQEQAKKWLDKYEVITPEQDKDAYHGKSFVKVVYGDTDSTIDSLLRCYSGNKMISEVFEAGEKNGKMITQNGTELVSSNEKILNYSKEGELEYQNVKYIMRHKVTKPKWRLKTKSGKEIVVTNDHSMIVFRNGIKMEVKPKDILPTDKILIVLDDCMKYIFDDIEVCECIGMFEDEYVYDIEMDDETHTFIANDILVHNSLYISYEGILSTIKGIEDMPLERKRDIIVDFNTMFMDGHNCEYIKDYYDKRFGKSVHNFELETLNKAGIWLDVKKRYAQILLWKDGKVFDIDSLPMKVKGLEMTKSSYPKAAREGLTRTIRYLLEQDDKQYLVQKINIKVQEEKKKWMDADIESICLNQKVSNYQKYILNDNEILQFTTGCPAGPKAVGLYNHLRNKHHLDGDPIYSGKVKMYVVKRKSPKEDERNFAFVSQHYPKWAEQYAPVDKTRMFEKMFLDPLNRIITSGAGLQPLNCDGSIMLSLF